MHAVRYVALPVFCLRKAMPKFSLQIRANSLSGDCKFTREFQRGFVAFSKQHQVCVRRRAVLSVASNPACPDKETAERAVNEVWESCFNDTRPFDEVRISSNSRPKSYF